MNESAWIYRSLFFLSSWVGVLVWGVGLLMLLRKLTAMEAQEALSVGGVLFIGSLVVMLVLLYWVFSQNSRLGYLDGTIWTTLSQPRYMLVVNLVIFLSGVVLLSSIIQKDLEVVDRETEQARELRVLYEVARIAASSRDLNQLFVRVLDIGPLLDMQAGWLAYPNNPDDSIIANATGMSKQAMAAVGEWSKKVVRDPAFRPNGSAVIYDYSSKHGSSPPPGFALAMALQVKGKSGSTPVLFMASTRHSIHVGGLLRTMRGLISLLDLGVENLQYASNIAYLAAKLERNRMANEVHDGLSQSLARTLMLTALFRATPADDPGRLAQVMDEIEDEVNRAYEKTRESIDFLKEERVDRTAYPEANPLAIDRPGQGDRDLRFHLKDAFFAINRSTAVRVFQILAEAFRNIESHSDASRVDVSFNASDPSTGKLSIYDNGIGCDLDLVSRRSTRRWGLSIMRERAESIGGRLSISSKPGHGTRVELEVPVTPIVDAGGDKRENSGC